LDSAIWTMFFDAVAAGMVELVGELALLELVPHTAANMPIANRAATAKGGLAGLHGGLLPRRTLALNTRPHLRRPPPPGCIYFTSLYLRPGQSKTAAADVVDHHRCHARRAASMS
jgi:hypothetical protein